MNNHEEPGERNYKRTKVIEGVVHIPIEPMPSSGWSHDTKSSNQRETGTPESQNDVDGVGIATMVVAVASFLALVIETARDWIVLNNSNLSTNKCCNVDRDEHKYLAKITPTFMGCHLGISLFFFISSVVIAILCNGNAVSIFLMFITLVLMCYGFLSWGRPCKDAKWEGLNYETCKTLDCGEFDTRLPVCKKDMNVYMNVCECLKENKHMYCCFMTDPEQKDKDVPEQKDKNVPEKKDKDEPEQKDKNVPEQKDKDVPDQKEKDEPDQKEKDEPDQKEKDEPDQKDKNLSVTDQNLKSVIMCLDKDKNIVYKDPNDDPLRLYRGDDLMVIPVTKKDPNYNRMVKNCEEVTLNVCYYYNVKGKEVFYVVFPEPKENVNDNEEIIEIYKKLIMYWLHNCDPIYRPSLRIRSIPTLSDKDPLVIWKLTMGLVDVAVEDLMAAKEIQINICHGYYQLIRDN